MAVVCLSFGPFLGKSEYNMSASRSIPAADRDKKCYEFTSAKDVCFGTNNVSSKPIAVLSIDRGPWHYLVNRLHAHFHGEALRHIETC